MQVVVLVRVKREEDKPIRVERAGNALLWVEIGAPNAFRSPQQPEGPKGAVDSEKLGILGVSSAPSSQILSGVST